MLLTVHRKVYVNISEIYENILNFTLKKRDVKQNDSKLSF